MTIDDFLRSAPDAHPDALRALWHDAHGDWMAAHEAAQADERNKESAWVHAYLHRREGDAFNAGYWYRRAGKPMCTGSLEDEWAGITEALLSRVPRSGSEMGRERGTTPA